MGDIGRMSLWIFTKEKKEIIHSMTIVPHIHFHAGEDLYISIYILLLKTLNRKRLQSCEDVRGYIIICIYACNYISKLLTYNILYEYRNDS